MNIMDVTGLGDSFRGFGLRTSACVNLGMGSTLTLGLLVKSPGLEVDQMSVKVMDPYAYGLRLESTRPFKNHVFVTWEIRVERVVVSIAVGLI